MSYAKKWILEFEDTWLEVRSYVGRDAKDLGKQALELPPISEALEVATNTNKDSMMWDYSRKLHKEEAEQVKRVLFLTKTAEDSRSISLSTNVTYKGSCFTLTLFVIKRSE